MAEPARLVRDFDLNLGGNFCKLLLLNGLKFLRNFVFACFLPARMIVPRPKNLGGAGGFGRVGRVRRVGLVRQDVALRRFRVNRTGWASRAGSDGLDTAGRGGILCEKRVGFWREMGGNCLKMG
jgi:hypothetical protein